MFLGRLLLKEVAAAADWKVAEVSGRVVPAPSTHDAQSPYAFSHSLQGVDADYDAAVEALAGCGGDLEAHLRSVRQRLGAGKDVSFASVNGTTAIEVRCWRAEC